MRIRIACTLVDRLRGLFGCPGLIDVLMLVPCNDVHTFGMRDPIDIAFIGEDGRVLDARRNVGAGKRVKSKSAVAVLERFADDAPWFCPGEYVQIYQTENGIREIERSET